MIIREHIKDVYVTDEVFKDFDEMYRRNKERAKLAKKQAKAEAKAKLRSCI